VKFSKLKAGGLLVAAIVVLVPLSLAAQQSGSQGAGAPPGKPGYGSTHQAPCWKQAGIPQSVTEQHHSIEQNMHSQVQAVCSDTSLSDQQKREKIRDIRKAAHEQMEGLLTADQLSKLESCRASHGGGHGGEHKGGGPCGELAGKPAEAAPPPK